MCIRDRFGAFQGLVVLPVLLDIFQPAAHGVESEMPVAVEASVPQQVAVEVV